MAVVLAAGAADPYSTEFVAFAFVAPNVVLFVLAVAKAAAFLAPAEKSDSVA